MGFHHRDQAGLKLLTSGDLPASASRSVEITGMSHHIQPRISFLHGVSGPPKEGHSMGPSLVQCFHSAPHYKSDPMSISAFYAELILRRVLCLGGECFHSLQMSTLYLSYLDTQRNE